jgi:hypothetical protein
VVDQWEEEAAVLWVVEVGVAQWAVEEGANSLRAFIDKGSNFQSPPEAIRKLAI